MSRGRLHVSFRPAALLGWWPEMVAAEACRSSPLRAGLTGMLACTLQMAPVLSTIGWLNEPFPDLKTYLVNAFTALPCALLGSVFAWGLLFLGIALSGRMVSPATALGTRIFCISPIATIIPGIAWSCCAFLAVLAHPSNNLSSGATKPSWLTSWPIAVAGSCGWLLVGVVLMTANGVVAHRQASKTLAWPRPPLCDGCSYNLTGNESGVCPECGRPVQDNAVNNPVTE